MRRLSYLAMLMVLCSYGSSAEAGYSFLIGGHHIYIDARGGCRSLSCVSWSGTHGWRHRRDRDEDVVKISNTKPATTAPAPTPAAAPPQPAPVVQAPPPPAPAPVAQVQPAPAAPPAVTAPATKLATETVAPPQPAPATKTDLATTTQSVPSPATKSEPAKTVVIEKPVETPVAPPPPSTQLAAEPARAKQDFADPDSPLGDWQTEGNKGLVRIEPCGRALCGYVLNAATNAKGETVLSNMKAKTDSQWTGDIYSRASGNSYFAKMTLKAPNTLHVEACAFSRFFCSGNDWTRVVTKPDEVIISRQSTPEPKS